MVYVLLAPDWLQQEIDAQPLQGEYTQEQIESYNAQGYNIYYYPNYPKFYHNDGFLKGSHIDTFEWVFIDMDLKDGKYQSKDEFVKLVIESGITPTKIVDTGGGVHVYWRVVDLDSMSFLKLNRRLARHFDTDLAVSKIKQLMRVPGSFNTKLHGNPRLCEQWYDDPSITYTCEDLDRLLPALTKEDEEYCTRHYDQTYNVNTRGLQVDESLPPKFGQLLLSNSEVKEIWSGETNDRSKSDFRLGHIMLAHGFTKDEAMSVLVNSGKALGRGTGHRISYAENIIEKIWTYEKATDKASIPLSSSVREILSKAGDNIKGTRFPCHRYIDATERGFRLGDVIGLVAGSGVGKTAIALNMFLGFVDNNPDYDHFFITLEQPANEIADRWRSLCGDRTHLHDRVQVISNYDENDNFRHLSLEEIQKYLVQYKKETGRSVGCVVVDHIGILKNTNKNGENEGLMGICKDMKQFAQNTKTVLVMQSQAPRQKAGIGDLELNKDAAYGTIYFESFCDYLITVWQPLKRCYAEGAPTVTAFKFCKIRHKKQGVDLIQEDVPYRRMFSPQTQLLTELTSEQEKSFDFFLKKANNKRDNSGDEIVQYVSVTWDKEESSGKVDTNKNIISITRPASLS